MVNINLWWLEPGVAGNRDTVTMRPECHNRDTEYMYIRNVTEQYLHELSY